MCAPARAGSRMSGACSGSCGPPSARTQPESLPFPSAAWGWAGSCLFLNAKPYLFASHVLVWLLVAPLRKNPRETYVISECRTGRAGSHAHVWTRDVAFRGALPGALLLDKLAGTQLSAHPGLLVNVSFPYPYAFAASAPTSAQTAPGQVFLELTFSCALCGWSAVACKLTLSVLGNRSLECLFSFLAVSFLAVRAD